MKAIFIMRLDSGERIEKLVNVEGKYFEDLENVEIDLGVNVENHEAVIGNIWRWRLVGSDVIPVIGIGAEPTKDGLEILYKNGWVNSHD